MHPGQPARSRGWRSPRTAMPNAFAIGRSPKTATVCATTGILELLTPSELDGVLAHELTHVQNRDVMVMTIASFFASIASFIVQMGFWFGGFGGDDNEDGLELHGRDPRLGRRLRDLVRPAPGALPLPRVRRRPRLGDHHRPPERADQRAAEDLRRDGADPPARPAGGQRRDGRVLHLPAEDEAGAQPLFATHPPLEARIAALQRYEAQLQGTGADRRTWASST